MNGIELRSRSSLKVVGYSLLTIFGTLALGCGAVWFVEAVAWCIHKFL